MLRHQNSPADEEVDGEIDASCDQEDFNRPVGGRDDFFERIGVQV